MIKLVKVSKSFGNVKALDAVDLEIATGEFIFITGPSGAGKTTLLKLIFGEVVPESGDVIIGGDNIVDFNQKEIQLLRQKIGVVFQDFKLLFERTVTENIEVALAVCGIPEDEWGSRVDNVLKLVNLVNRANFFPAQLSGGELQRVTMARALVVNPDIVIADEPTGNLDWDTAEDIIKLLETVNKEGKTVIVATHHKILVDKEGARVIKFKDGKVVSDSKAKSNKKPKDSKKDLEPEVKD